jgi:hypothetical protein
MNKKICGATSTEPPEKQYLAKSKGVAKRHSEAAVRHFISANIGA